MDTVPSETASLSPLAMPDIQELHQSPPHGLGKGVSEGFFDVRSSIYQARESIADSPEQDGCMQAEAQLNSPFKSKLKASSAHRFASF